MANIVKKFSWPRALSDQQDMFCFLVNDHNHGHQVYKQ